MIIYVQHPTLMVVGYGNKHCRVLGIHKQIGVFAWIIESMIVYLSGWVNGPISKHRGTHFLN